MMFLKLPRTIIKAICVIIACSIPIYAQLLKYDNDMQRLGAIAAGPRITSMALINFKEFCDKEFPNNSKQVTKAVNDWHVRNARYIKLSEQIFASIKLQLDSKPMDEATRKNLKFIFIESTPKNVENFLNMLTQPLKAPDKTMCEKVLIDLCASIADGKLDVKSTDPELCRFMDQLINKSKATN